MKEDLSRKLAKGYIGLFRSIQAHWVWDDKPVSRGQAWVDMLIWASHKDRETPVTDGFVQIKTGQFIRTLRQMGESWGWSKNKVSRFLALLQEANMIRLENGTNTTHVSILKYETYRELTMSGGTKVGQRRDKDGTRKGHNKEYNNYKETNNSMSATVKPYAERVSIFFENINVDLKQTWADAYPNIDIDYQLGKAKAWLLSNTNKAKKDFPKFINNWLARAMEMPGSQVIKPTTPKLKKYICVKCDNRQQSSIDYWKLKCSKCGSEGTMVTPHEYPYMKKSYDENE
tara:strand:- start:1779 stop:2639 length:861 start_codon:yes stop_codon:yes gene_type:complete